MHRVDFFESPFTYSPDISLDIPPASPGGPLSPIQSTIAHAVAHVADSALSELAQSQVYFSSPSKSLNLLQHALSK